MTQTAEEKSIPIWVFWAVTSAICLMVAHEKGSKTGYVTGLNEGTQAGFKSGYAKALEDQGFAMITTIVRVEKAEKAK